MDSGKIEERAIKPLSDIIDMHDTMESRIKHTDKTMTWDGSIVIFKPDADKRSKNTLDYEVPVQIKGHVDKNKEYVFKKRLSYPVDIKDLQLYHDNYGCVYFQVFITEDARKREVFYSMVYPSKAKSYLENANKKKNKRYINVSFTRLDKSPKSLYKVLKQFSQEVIKQGSGRGQIVPKMIRIEDLSKVRQLSLTVVGAMDDIDVFKGIIAGDICLYGSFDDNSIEYPIEWTSDHNLYLRKSVVQTIKVDGTLYYSSYEIQLSSTEEWMVFLSKNLEINLTSGKVHFKPVSDLKQVRNDAEFLLALEKGKAISFGDKAKIEYKNVDISNGFKNKLYSHIVIDDIMQNLSIAFSVPVCDLNEEDLSSLQRILDFREGRLNDCLPEQFNLFYWKLCGKDYPVVIARHEHDSQNDLFNAAYDQKLCVSVVSEDGTQYRIPLISALDDNVFANLYCYDYDSIVEQFDGSDINGHTVDYLENTALKLVSAYDATKDKGLLEIARYAMNRVKEINGNKPNFIINCLQIKARVSGLDSNDYAQLNCIDDDNICSRFCVNVLKNNKDESSMIFDSMTEEEKTGIVGFPIMALFDALKDDLSYFDT